MTTPRCLLLAIALSIGSSAALGQTVKLKSGYLVYPVGPYHGFELTIKFEGDAATGTLYADPNACGHDLFGDIDACTAAGGAYRPVTLEKLPVADPAKTGRRLWSLKGETGIPGELTLVVPGDGGDGYRLVHTSERGDRIPIPLSRSAAP